MDKTEKEARRAFGEWYMMTQAGPLRMYSRQSVEQAIPAVVSDRLRDAWYASGDENLTFLASVATDILLLYKEQDGT